MERLEQGKIGNYIPLSSALILVQFQSNSSIIQVVTTMNEKSSQTPLSRFVFQLFHTAKTQG